MFANLILVINPIINFVIYEKLKKIAIQKFGSEKNIPFSSIFLMSSIGKICATLVTYPILTIKIRAQASQDKEKKESLGIRDLYKGLEAKIVQTCLYNAFLMASYEKLRYVIKVLLFRAIYLRVK